MSPCKYEAMIKDLSRVFFQCAFTIQPLRKTVEYKEKNSNEPEKKKGFDKIMS